MADFVSFGHNQQKYAIFSKDIYVEFIDPVFAKTLVLMMENERLCKERFDLFSRKLRLYIGTLLLRTFQGARYTQGFSKNPAFTYKITFFEHMLSKVHAFDYDQSYANRLHKYETSSSARIFMACTRHL
jgi:hypothetical protein